MDIEKETKSLVDSLELKISPLILHFGTILMFADKQDGKFVWCLDTKSTFNDLDNLLDYLLRKIKTFVMPNGEEHENPYFGCQSLEEALIKKDLLIDSIKI